MPTPMPRSDTVVGPRRIRRPLVVLIAGAPESASTTGLNSAYENSAYENSAYENSAYESARRLFELGHVPIVGEDLARPLSRDADFAGTYWELAMRMMVRCDAVLRVGAPSPWTDMIVDVARWEGKRVFYRPDEIPSPA